MRETISNFLTKNAINDPSFYVLSGDHGYALFDEIRKFAPKQFINVGVSEQAMVGYAAGMIKQGLKVVIYGLASFVPIRVLEFIKMNICYENLPLIILGDGAGIVYSTLGSSHQCAEDIACMRSLPNMSIFSPCDKFEMNMCLNKAFHLNTPSYIRIGKSDNPPIHKNEIPLKKEASLHQIMKSMDNKTCLIATGSMVSTAASIAQKFNLSIFSMPEITPLNEEIVKAQLKDFENVVSLEEHSISGGIGSIIAEIIAENNLNLSLKRIGIKNRFTQKCGSYEYVIQEHELDEQSIIKEIKNIFL
jgi:transketolase